MNITPKERTAILQSLAAGVVPAVGLHHIQVGRKDEVSALIRDLELTAQGASTIRFVIGQFGSGKTFFLNLIQNVAHQRKFVVARADITTDRRLQGGDGQARSFYSELMRNLSTRSRPEGGAMPSVVERWVGDVEHEIKAGGGKSDDVKREFAKKLRPLQDLVSGFDFVNVITKYYEGFLDHSEELQTNALRWLRGEYTAKTDARRDLDVRTIVDDVSYYDYLKLLAKFVRIAGYAGLVVNVDELVVLSHRLSNTTARNKNYEAILRIINDCLQGNTEGLSFLFAGTNDCLEDRRRGLYSYDALATRLAPNRFATDGRQDFSSPVLKLQSLTPEDCFVLLANIRSVQAGGDKAKYLLPDEALVEYLKDCNSRMGAAYFQTPRETVMNFVKLLNMLDQDRTQDWRVLLNKELAANPPMQPPPEHDVPASDDLTEFQL